ncbi:MAG: xanthan lyase [Bacteroidales bacterium]|nr:xanthan lyase [Bacteroidales bacterium]
MRACRPLIYIVLSLVFLFSTFTVNGQSGSRAEKAALSRLAKWTSPVGEWYYPQNLRIDSLKVDGENRLISIYFPVALSWNPIREEKISRLERSVKESLGRKFRDYTIIMYTNGFTPDQLIPNYFRNAIAYDTTRIPLNKTVRPMLVKRIDGVHPVKGLNENYIALWHSHGYYFDMTLDRWEYQRAKLFGTVEDISVMAYVIPFLAPMLENAGATVFLPRERDVQLNEVIVDNDISTGGSEFVIHVDGATELAGEGFLKKDTLFAGENPFTMGTSIRISDGYADFIPDIPERGYYAVHISYPRSSDNSSGVTYRVTHAGGSTDFIVNQAVGGGTWLYLGTFLFDRGRSVSAGSVSVAGDGKGVVSLDAVRFGGGMGNVARRPSSSVMPNQRSLNATAAGASPVTSTDSVSYRWKISGKPRFLEGARYWLQYAGMPDTLVYSLNREKNDYNDDYMSRAEWVNYLTGTAGKSGKEGLGLPVDLSLAFHTDAGITPDDSIIGTLGIYSTAAGEGLFPDGVSRLASRDLTDIVQTQIVDDISALFNPDWTRRGLWDRSYYEARKPNVPAMLLELLSHQNLADQRYGLDPRFRFHVSRAVYKGILKYLAFNSGRDYTVQPLPVSHMAITRTGDRTIRLSWNPVADPVEPTAVPSSYRVYTRTGDGGFDNGREVIDSSIEIGLPEYNTIYSFRVTAVNDGGESFPSEILAAGLFPESKETVLVINGFDRVSGPAWFDRGGIAGVEWWNDRGVAYNFNLETTGDQYDFYRLSPWTDDDNAGWGASYTNTAGKIIPGNTFDYPAIHGRSIMAAGRSFISVSDEVFNDETFDILPYCAADIILGEEKTTFSAHDSTSHDFRIYTPGFLNSLERLAAASLPVFMSGSYTGTDLMMTGDTALISRVGALLHFKPRSGHAVRSGELFSTDIAAPDFNGSYSFNTGDSGAVYSAEAPDAIEPHGRGSFTAFRYTENNTSAAVMHRGKVKTVVLGFPFETLIYEDERDNLMRHILDFLLNE